MRCISLNEVSVLFDLSCVNICPCSMLVSYSISLNFGMHIMILSGVSFSTCLEIYHLINILLCFIFLCSLDIEL